MRRFFKTKRGALIRVDQIAAVDWRASRFGSGTSMIFEVVVITTGGVEILAASELDRGPANEEYNMIVNELHKWWVEWRGES